MKTIIIAGGTGFLGSTLENHLTKKGYRIKILTRNPTKENHINWDGENLDEWTNHLENSETLINLAGKSVDCRYNKTNKQLIYNSRIDSTNIIGEAIKACKTPPKVWLNASTSTIYRHSLDKEMCEFKGEIGDDFSMNIAKSWEKAFNTHKTPKTRKVILRTSIVLGKNGGAFVPLKRLTQFGFGGKQGKGNQKVSWIHEYDFNNAVTFLIENNYSGIFNIVSPKPVTNSTFMKTLRNALKIPLGLPQPKWLLKLGARLINTEAELVLKSRNVVPKRLLELGFKFQYATLKDTFNNLIQR